MGREMGLQESYKFACELKPVGQEYPLLVASIMPTEKRDSIAAVLGSFRMMIDDVFDCKSGEDPEMVFESWRNLLKCASENDNQDHPLYPALTDTLAKFPLHLKIWDDFSDAIRFHMENRHIEDMAAFRQYSRLSYGSAMQAFVQILSSRKLSGGYFTQVKPEFLAEELASMIFIVQVLKDLGADLRSGSDSFIYIPKSRLSHYSLSIEDLAGFANGNEIDSRFRGLVDYFYHLGREYELFVREKLVLVRGEMDKEEWFALDLLLNIYSRFLHRIWEFPQSIFNGGFPIDPAMVFINALKLQKDLGLEFKQDLSKLLSHSA